MSLDPAVRARIESLLATNPVVLFMKGNPNAPQCGFSSKAVGALDAAGADYAHVDVLSDPEIREGIKAYGDWPTIPQLYIGGELVGGSDIILQMAGSGELHAALGLPAPDRTPPSITITLSSQLCMCSPMAAPGSKAVMPLIMLVEPQRRVTSGVVRAPPPRSLVLSSAGRRMAGWAGSGMVDLISLGLPG